MQTLCSRSSSSISGPHPWFTHHGIRAAWCSSAVACVAILISGEARSGRSVWELSGSACDPRSSSQIMLLHTREWEMRARSRNAYTVAVIRELVSSVLSELVFKVRVDTDERNTILPQNLQ